MLQHRWVITILLFCCQSIAVYATDRANYSLSRTTITVSGLNSGFTREVEKKGFNPSLNQHQVQIAYTELESVQNLVATYNTGKKDIALKATEFTDHSLLTSSFYDGLRAKRFVFPETAMGNYFAYSYTVQAKELIFLSSLPWYSEKQTDTLEYIINLPEGLSLIYRIDGDTVSNGTFSITQKGSQYVFRYIKDADQEFKKLNYDEAPLIRLLVLDKNVNQASTKETFDYFGAWYQKLIAPQVKLPSEMPNIFKVALGDTSVSAERMFNFIKSNVNYIDIENGIGAIQPRNMLDVYNNKQGDCKDMANLLCQSLRYMGYEAHLAISSTLSHRFDLDFPTISSANHVICVLKQDGKWIYLDATERYGTFGIPSRQIQGRHILILHADHSELNYVEPVVANENKLVSRLNLTTNQNQFEGTALYTLSGFQQYDLQFYRNYHTASEFQNKADKYFSSFSPSITHTYTSCPENDLKAPLVYNATIKTGKVITQVGAKNYISTTFLPWPHQLPDKIDTAATYVTYMQYLNQYEVALNFNEPVKLLGSPTQTFEKDGFKFNFKVEQVNDQQLVVTYQCQIDHLIIDKEKIKTLIELNEAILQTFSKAITYEKL